MKITMSNGQVYNVRPGANLAGADLAGANLRRANLKGTNLKGANLAGADLAGANLRDAYLRRANLEDANLAGADLRGAYLRRANLEDANLKGATLPNYSICPGEGDFVAYKSVLDRYDRKVVLKLLIQGDRTSSLVGRKCRTNKALVLGAVTETTETVFFSGYNLKFVYRLGRVVEEPNYNSDIRVECAEGIHFFVTQEEAENW